MPNVLGIDQVFMEKKTEKYYKYKKKIIKSQYKLLVLRKLLVQMRKKEI